MKKSWFDKRAEDGFWYTIAPKREISYSPNTWSEVVTLYYIPVKVLGAHPHDVQTYGKMTQDEAIAMAKLLNASETN
jgi:nicotinic acid phosphoribosyltransferase